MVKNFLSKILARDLNGLNIISTYCEDSTTSVSEIKYLKKNKIFLLSLTRKSLKDNKKSNIISVCKFEFIENVVAKNVDQKNSKLKGANQEVETRISEMIKTYRHFLK